jgi:hypothetical protein
MRKLIAFMMIFIAGSLFVSQELIADNTSPPYGVEISINAELSAQTIMVAPVSISQLPGYFMYAAISHNEPVVESFYTINDRQVTPQAITLNSTNLVYKEREAIGLTNTSRSFI